MITIHTGSNHYTVSKSRLDSILSKGATKITSDVCTGRAMEYVVDLVSGARLVITTTTDAESNLMNRHIAATCN